MQIDNVIRELDLGTVANSFIGTSQARGISGGERKRLNIATELMIAPCTFFGFSFSDYSLSYTISRRANQWPRQLQRFFFGSDSCQYSTIKEQGCNYVNTPGL